MDEYREVKVEEVQEEAWIIAEFLDYIRQLAEMDGEMQIPIGKLWTVYQEGCRKGRYWTDITDDLHLPDPVW